ncbi:hypothetical protein SXCC_00153 [Gluconacetobacter sp. SXCC-1]|nr:hypothetical protein SXCC_00153 [Gluconacetobacter sp. SXCC-1]
MPANLRTNRSQEVGATARSPALRADAPRPGTERGVVILRHGQTSRKPGFSGDSAVRNDGTLSLLKNDGSDTINPECQSTYS